MKFARAFGADVVLFTTSPGKAADALRLGAHEVVLSKDEAQLAAHAGRFDFILDTVSAAHDLNALFNLLKRDGNLVLVGAPEKPLPVAAFPLIMRRRSFFGSLIGGLPETPRSFVLDCFCWGRGALAAFRRIIRAEGNAAPSFSKQKTLPETQEMLDFCGTHGIASDIEMIRMDQSNDAYERMLRSDVKYRFVIDLASLK